MSPCRLCAVKRAGAVAPAGAFPHELLEEAEARWKAAVRAPPHASQLQVGLGVTLLMCRSCHGVQVQRPGRAQASC